MEFGEVKIGVRVFGHYEEEKEKLQERKKVFVVYNCNSAVIVNKP